MPYVGYARVQLANMQAESSGIVAYHALNAHLSNLVEVKTKDSPDRLLQIFQIPLGAAYIGAKFACQFACFCAVLRLCKS